MQKVITVYIMIAFIMCCFNSFTIISSAEAPEIWNGERASAFAGGSGTIDDPWQISNGAQFAYMAYLFNTTVLKDDMTVYGLDSFVLTADIYLNDISNYKDWGLKNEAPANVWSFLPIGLGGYGLTGSFDGQEHSIIGLYQVTGGKGGGLFYDVLGGTVRNVNLVDCLIYAESYCGALSALNHGTISDCNISGKVSGVYSNFFGGICGNNSGTIENCVFRGSVSSVGIYTGGIVGNESDGATITNCINYGSVTGSADSNSGSSVGGIAGMIGNLTTNSIVSNCYNAGSVTGTGSVGGIVGCVGYKEDGAGSVIQDCYNIGAVSIADQNIKTIGAVVGYCCKNASISNCYYDSDLTGLSGIGTDNASMSSGVNGLATSVMQGKDAVSNMNLSSSLWTAIDGYYPQIKTLNDNGWTIVSPVTGNDTSGSTSNNSDVSTGDSSSGTGDNSESSAIVAGSESSSIDTENVADATGNDTQESLCSEASKSTTAGESVQNTDSDDSTNSGSSLVWLWIVLGVLVLAGAGVSVYLFILKKEKVGK